MDFYLQGICMRETSPQPSPKGGSVIRFMIRVNRI